jgi:hypothetical protein
LKYSSLISIPINLLPRFLVLLKLVY